MKVKFKDGTIRRCASPIEQKVFRGGESAGWILMLKLLGEITSSELDSILKPENITELEFFTTENGVDKALFTLFGYEKITSSSIRYAEDMASTITEIQLTKGI